MISEKAYWWILSIGFAIFALLLWLWLIPYNVIEYNLAVNLFTSSIFMVLTVIFLTLIFNAQQSKRWNKVKNSVYEEIGIALEHIFRSMVPYFEGGGIDWFRFNRMKPNASKEFDAHLLKLIEGKIRLDKEGMRIFCENEELREHEFVEFANRLNDIESKYFQFLDPIIVESLIVVEKNISNFKYAADFAVKVPAMFKAIAESKKADGKLSNKFKELSAIGPDQIEPLLLSQFISILKEIAKLKKAGIPIYNEKQKISAD